MIEEYVENLAKQLGKENLIKQGVGRYFVRSNLVLIDSFDQLPVYLTEVGDNVYFVDFGVALEDKKLDSDKLVLLTKELSRFDVTLEEGSLSLKSSKELIFLNYNIFVMALSYIQMFCKLNEN